MALWQPRLHVALGIAWNVRRQLGDHAKALRRPDGRNRERCDVRSGATDTSEAATPGLSPMGISGRPQGTSSFARRRPARRSSVPLGPVLDRCVAASRQRETGMDFDEFVGRCEQAWRIFVTGDPGPAMSAMATCRGSTSSPGSSRTSSPATTRSNAARRCSAVVPSSSRSRFGRPPCTKREIGRTQLGPLWMAAV
jgi:hypothetical protein